MNFLKASFFWVFLIVISPLSSTYADSMRYRELLNADQFHWVSLSFDRTPPPSRLIQSLKRAVERRTSVVLNAKQHWVSYLPEELKNYRFLHLEMCGFPPEVSVVSQLHWRDFFNQGGVLYLDICPNEDSRLISEWKDWAISIYPGTSWRPLHGKDVLSFSFYLLDKRMLLSRGSSSIHVLKNDGRFMMILNRNPELGWQALTERSVTAFLNPGNQEIRLRFYINLILYTLTGHYKQDQLHLPTILLRRK